VDHAIIIRYNTRTLPLFVFNNIPALDFITIIIKIAVKQMLHGRRKHLF